jgi:hypothetical protein
MSTFAQAATNLAKAAERVAGPASEHALVKAGVVAKGVINNHAQAELGSDATLSRFGRGRSRGRIKAEARFDPQPGLKLVISPSKRSRGLWAFLEFGSKGAWHYPKRGRKRRDGTYSRAPVPARRTWTTAEPQVTAEAFKAFHRDLHADIARTITKG